MDKYLKLLKRKLVRAEEQIQKRRPSDSDNDLNGEGFRMLGYYQGRVSILEDAIDEIEEYLAKAI